MIVNLMNQDVRRWKTSYGALPVEYDVEIGCLVLGPEDTIRFSYRMLVDQQLALERGVRYLNLTIE
jgi:hypothetical protein